MGATMYGATTIQPVAPPAQRRKENLAFVFQDLLTVIVRMRSNRQPVADAQKFRTDVRGALRNAEKEAVSRGYMPDDVRLATFAVVAFLDESVLNSSNPAFSDWARMPLQEELYGHQLAGETFFQNLEKLLSRGDSQDLADLLEVPLLCLLLGYKGRYELSGQESLRPVVDSVAEKVRRIRGGSLSFSPAWAVPEGAVVTGGPDPWIRRLTFAAIGSVGLAIVLFVIFKLLLNFGASDLHALASQIH
jgi:type VI secretion system protein ImpK